MQVFKSFSSKCVKDAHVDLMITQTVCNIQNNNPITKNIKWKKNKDDAQKRTNVAPDLWLKLAGLFVRSKLRTD